MCVLNETLKAVCVYVGVFLSLVIGSVEVVVVPVVVGGSGEVVMVAVVMCSVETVVVAVVVGSVVVIMVAVLGNYLEDHSPHVYLVQEPSMQVAIEDFLYANGLDRDYTTVDYHVIDNYMELNDYMEDHELKNGEVIGFGIYK